jgi:uncharacterized protein (DUF433 family)
MATARKHDRQIDYEGLIRETPGVSGGYPCIGNTRISVRLVVEHYRATNDIDAVLDMLPLTPEQVEIALAYYRDHPARVDEDIERNARAWAELTSRGKSQA